MRDARTQSSIAFVTTDVETAFNSLTRREPLTTPERPQPSTVEMFTEEQLKTYLENISPNSVFFRFEFFNAEKFVIQIKCDIDQNKPIEFYSWYIDNWIKSFSKFTATIWTARNSYINRKTLLIKKRFECQPIDYKRKRDDAKRVCRAQIKFNFKLINVTTAWRFLIMIHFEHSHDVYTTPSTALLMSRMSDTDKLFYDYFDNGFNATTAKTYHELSLIQKHGTRSSQYLGDEDINPKIKHIKLLIDKMQSKDIKRSFSDIIEAKKAFIEDSGGQLMYIEKPQVVAIITPLMKRVIANNNLDCVLVDSSIVKIGLVVTLFYITNKIGALPIACALHTEATETNFKQAFKTMNTCINRIKSSFYPKTFIVNDMREQKNALSLFFPNTKLIASRWSICSEIWKWLCNEDLKIDHCRRNSFMFLFKSLVHASAKGAHTHYTKLLTTNDFEPKTQLREYIERLWRRSDEWMVKEDFQTYPLTEVSIKLIKEFMLRKCRFFNIIMMIDVVSKLLENHLKTLISTYVDGMPSIANYTTFFHRAYSTQSIEDFTQIRFNEYMVLYQSSPNLYYHLKIDTNCCDCAVGKQGRLCDHLGIVLNSGSAGIEIPILTNSEVHLLMKYIGLSNNNIKCKLLEDEHKTESTDGATNVEENTVDLNKCQRDCAEDDEEIAPEADFYGLEQHKSINKIRAIKKSPHKVVLDTKHTIVERKPSLLEYMKSLGLLNDKFQTLIKYLKRNADPSNLATVKRLSDNLDAARQQISLENVSTDVIKYKKRKLND